MLARLGSFDSAHVLIRYLPLLLIALAWEASARAGLVSSLALPPLSKVVTAWFDLAQNGDLLVNGLSSLYRAGAGLALAIVIGATLGVFMAWWRPLNHAAGHARRLQRRARQRP